MAARVLPFLKYSNRYLWEGFQMTSAMKAFSWTLKPLSIQSSFFPAINTTYQSQALTIMRRMFEEENTESEIDRAILNVNTHRRKKTKLKKSKRRQRRKKLRNLSDRKRKKLNLI